MREGNLILNRKPGQSIVINHGEIRIEILEIRGKIVTLRFTATKDILILREEFKEKSACNTTSTKSEE